MLQPRTSTALLFAPDPSRPTSIEYVDHLHEHFLDPVVIRNGHYLVPEKPGYSIEMKARSLHDYAYPGGSVWTEMGIGNHAAES